jgi:hypothetical protein
MGLDRYSAEETSIVFIACGRPLKVDDTEEQKET